jgi:hypothetical protein
MMKKHIFRLLGHLIYYCIYALSLTIKTTRLGDEIVQLEKDKHPSGSVVFATWHQLLFTTIITQKNEKIQVMVSRSLDGELVCPTAEKMGYVPVRGSSRKGNIDKGGKKAMAQMIDNIFNKGLSAGIAVDGPKGPAKKVKAGVIKIASETGASIIPSLSSARDYWSFKSWDEFRVPKPFTRVIVRQGKPIPVPKDLGMEGLNQYKTKVEKALLELESLIERDFKELS